MSINAERIAMQDKRPTLADYEHPPLQIKKVFAANGCETCGADVLQISAARIRCERDASHTVRFERLARRVSLPPASPRT